MRVDSESGQFGPVVEDRARGQDAARDIRRRQRAERAQALRREFDADVADEFGALDDEVLGLDAGHEGILDP